MLNRQSLNACGPMGIEENCEMVSIQVRCGSSFIGLEARVVIELLAGPEFRHRRIAIL